MLVGRSRPPGVVLPGRARAQAPRQRSAQEAVDAPPEAQMGAAEPAGIEPARDVKLIFNSLGSDFVIGG